MANLVKHISKQKIDRDCDAIVMKGSMVRKGQVIAFSKDRTTKIYSTVDGRVKGIEDTAILIEYEALEEEKPKTAPVSNQNLQTRQHIPSHANSPEFKAAKAALSNPIFIDKAKENVVNTSNNKTIEENQDTQPTNDKAQKNTSPIMPTTKNKRFNVDALDGLRTLAIISVIFYHLNFQWLKGGLIGVTIFFVLSGYLITGILKNEIEITGKVNLKKFWIHRVRRLFPAIVCVIVIVAILCVAINHILLTKMKPDIIPSLVWLQNWWYIFRGLSYFEALGDPSPLVHFWSLAIEEQFYLIWPLILIGAYKLGANNKIIRSVCLVLAMLSAIEMFILYDPQADPTRVYYGTDTRAFSLLIGAFLAFIWPWQKFKTQEISLKKSHRKILDITGIIALAAIIIIMILVEGTAPAMYNGVLFLASCLTAIIIANLVVPGNKLAKIFEFKPFVWIGKRSYGMYLWHFPLILLLKPICDDTTNTWWFASLIIALTIGISAVQYKFIENPIRRGKLGKWYKTLKKQDFDMKPSHMVLSLLCAIIIAGTAIAIIVTPDEYLVPEEAIESTGEDANSAMYVEGTYSPLLVADSIAGAIKLQNYFPHGLNDSVVGRRPGQAINVLKDYASKNSMGNVVIVSCFDNLELKNNELDEMLQACGPSKELFLVTCYLKKSNCDANNAAIKDFASKHDNVHIIDWYSEVSKNPDAYLYKDHIHPNIEGQCLYVKLIAQEVNQYLPEGSKCDISAIPQNARKK